MSFRLLTAIVLAVTFSAPAVANDVTVQEARSTPVETREAATDAALEAARSTCNGEVLTVGTQTEGVGDAYVAQVWYLCTPAQ